MGEKKEILWRQGKLYGVTGFNQVQPAEQTLLAQRCRDRWKTPFELAQVMIQGGYRLVDPRTVRPE